MLQFFFRHASHRRDFVLKLIASLTSPFVRKVRIALADGICDAALEIVVEARRPARQQSKEARKRPSFQDTAPAAA